MLRTGKWRTDWPSRLGRCTVRAASGRPTLLIHGVSVGEVNAVRQLVAMLRQTPDPPRIVISSTTDTGLAAARKSFAEHHDVVRYPLDFTFAVRRFLDAVRPDVVALVELEIWPNLVGECRRRGIDVCVINGRLSARSFKGYRRIRPLLRSTFASLAQAAVQSRAIADRFVAMGTPADRVQVMDTMKWDTAQLADGVPGDQALADAMGIDRSRPLIVAGSTGPGEEKLLIETCPAEAQLLLVPRKPERFEEVAALDPVMVRRSQRPDGGAARTPAGDRLFLLDTMGELRKAYALADVVIVGRSFLGLYGSDMMEPVALGKPTLIGPHHSDFAHIMEALTDARGILVTDRPGQAAAELLADPERAAAMAARGREVIRARQGATRRHAQMLLQLLRQAPQPRA